MCAISGLYRFRSRVTPEETQALEGITRALQHRGPDDEGFYRHERVLLGHRRLSILDTTPAGHQPFPNEDGTIQVVFNGEIYNFKDLRRELEAAGHRFRSRTDTEVLVHGYEVWGIEGLLARLRGMFAFALWDAAQERGGPRLVLARDRFGIKPLYYALDQEKIVFASEVRALRDSGLVREAIDPTSLQQFLQLGSVPAPHSTILGVRTLPAGYYLALQDKAAKPVRYWNFAETLTAPSVMLSHEEAVRECRRRLEATVLQHLVSDVPLGIFLSGGIDSSALVGLAAAARPGKLVTLAITFEEAAYNEAPYARRVAAHYRTDHREILLRRDDFTAQLPGLFAAMDQPSVDGVNTYFVSRAARQAGLKVVLSGLGADELFSGYRHLQKARQIEVVLRMISVVPGALRRAVLSAVAPLVSRVAPRAADKLWCLRRMSSETPYWLARGVFSPEWVARLTGISEADVRKKQPQLDPDSVLATLKPQERIRLLEYNFYLQNQLLKDSDVMSMAHSLELRVPYMDHELVESILRLPARPVPGPWIPKRLLVEAMGTDFPREVWQRPKQGFTFPFGDWMKQDGGDLEAMSLEKTPLDPPAVRRVWSEFRAGRLHWSRPWMTLVAARCYGQ